MFNTDQSQFVRLRAILKERTNPVVLWIGSGISTQAGMPTWQGLKDQLAQALEEKAQQLDEVSERGRLQGRLSSIKSDPNLWLAFQNLKEELGRTTYTECVRQAFSKAATCTIPENFKRLLKLHFSGILSLNIDRIATRAFSELYPGKNLIEFSGRSCGDFIHVLKGLNPFLVNLHGIWEDQSSWVFTRPDLNWLSDNEGYKNLINTILCSKTVVFVGISADDVAVGGHLEKLKNSGLDFGSHFWITDRADIKTDRWAEDAGVLLIRYDPHNDHIELGEMLDDISAFVPQDDIAEPVIAHVPETGTVDFPIPAELELRSDEEMRLLLNEHASYLLKDGDQNAYSKFEEFCKEYDRCIYRSWYVTTTPPTNLLFGHEIIEPIAEGAFGRVFKAINPAGEQVALKLLKEDVRRKPAMLQSFRRGVKSMHILESRKVQGMIPYRTSSEIPAFAVMDFVEGPNLGEAVKAGLCKEWECILRIGVALCTIIRSAHQLPERVLHRDIRPANIMLQDYYTNPLDYQVVVLDFDLSWYKGAEEISAIINASTINGYIAPEQVERASGVSTRNAAVDSFGLGMTLFFLRTQRNPIYMEHRHRDWKNSLFDQITSNRCKEWCSVPIRYARLIEFATQDNQEARWDCSQILGELERLYLAVSDPLAVEAAELIAEEIAFGASLQLAQNDQYEWDIDRQTGSIVLRSGITIECIANENHRCVNLKFQWTDSGTIDCKNVRKYLKPKCDAAISILRKGGWHHDSGPFFAADITSFNMSINLKEAIKDIADIKRSLVDAAINFKFD